MALDIAQGYGYGYGYGASRRGKRNEHEASESSDESEASECSSSSSGSNDSMESVDGPVEAEVVAKVEEAHEGRTSALPRRRSVTFKEEVLVVTDTSKEFARLSTKQGSRRRFKEPPPAKRHRTSLGKVLRSPPAQRNIQHILPTPSQSSPSGQMAAQASLEVLPERRKHSPAEASVHSGHVPGTVEIGIAGQDVKEGAAPFTACPGQNGQLAHAACEKAKSKDKKDKTREVLTSPSKLEGGEDKASEKKAKRKDKKDRTQEALETLTSPSKLDGGEDKPSEKKDKKDKKQEVLTSPSKLDGGEEEPSEKKA
ncbi:unnamed protein product, partial [Effrenium voratum]